MPLPRPYPSSRVAVSWDWGLVAMKPCIHLPSTVSNPREHEGWTRVGEIDNLALHSQPKLEPETTSTGLRGASLNPPSSGGSGEHSSATPGHD